MATPADFLQAPIPGQSLTATPKQYKWERPPQMSNHEEVVKFYINKLADQDVMDDLAVLFDGGMPITPFVETLTTTGVSEGLHTIDVSLIVGPVLHAFIKAAMLQYGIDAEDDVYDPENDPTEREKRRLMTSIELALADAASRDRTAETDTGVNLLKEVQQNLQEETEEAPLPEEDTVAETEAAPAETRRGLMARETM